MPMRQTDSFESGRRRVTLRRAVSVSVLSIGLAMSPVVAVAQTTDVTGQPSAQPADTLYREGTRALTKGNYRRAAGLFETLRFTYPRSPYVPDSYYWQAFALQRLEEPDAMRLALSALDEQQLRFPEAAAGDDVMALRSRVESMVTRDMGPLMSNAACADREDAAAISALSMLTMLTDPQMIQGHLATLLAMRTPCARELRRSAIYLLDRRLDADARRMLAVVAEKDPDEIVRAEARAVITRPAATTVSSAGDVPPQPPRRAAGDTASFFIGDTASAGVVDLGDRKNSRLNVRLFKPAQLVVLSVRVGESPVLLSPVLPRDARRVATGAFTVDLRPAELYVPYRVTASSTNDQAAFNLRREAEIEACISRQAAQAQARINKEWNARTDKSGKPTVMTGPAVDVSSPTGRTMALATSSCNQVASRTPPPPVTSVMRDGLTTIPVNDRYLVVLALQRPVSMPWLMVRVGTVEPAGATVAEMIDQLTSTLFTGHAGAWSGTVIPW